MRPPRTMLFPALVTALFSALVAGSIAVLVGASASQATVSHARAATGADGSSAVEERRADRFPNRRTAGVPQRWTPKRTIHHDVVVSRPGAVIENIRIVNGDLIIGAPDVTVRRVEVLGGVIANWYGGDCNSGLKVRATTIKRGPGQTTSGDEPALGTGGYTARRVEIVGVPEGFRVGGKDACGPVRIVNSFAVVRAPDQCDDWHGDALQGYDGGRLTVRNSVLKLKEREDCGGTAPFFYPEDQGNSSVRIDGLIVAGGGYSFRLGEDGDVRNLSIVAGSYGYGPIDVRCSRKGAWDAQIVRLHHAGQPREMRRQACNSNGGY